VEMINANIILDGKPDGMRPNGSHKRQCEGKDKINLYQGRHHKNDLVTKEMKFWVPLTDRKFLY
jgi:hypothetical protein